MNQNNLNNLNILYNLSNHLQQSNLLENVISQFQSSYRLQPRIGVEIEFYLSQDVKINKFERELLKFQKNIIFKQEKGKNQFEINLPSSTNILSYIQEIIAVTDHIKICASVAGGQAYLTAKPFLNDYGSAMHFHIDFIQMSPEKVDNTRKLAFNLELAANALCHYMLPTFLVFMPNKEDYLRIDKNFMTPTHVSRGGNNRTVAVRIPDSLPKRLEHRIASPTCDPYLAIYTILKSILLGFNHPHTITHYDMVYGNSFDPQYNLIPLPQDIEEALQRFDIGFFN